MAEHHQVTRRKIDRAILHEQQPAQISGTWFVLEPNTGLPQAIVVGMSSDPKYSQVADLMLFPLAISMGENVPLELVTRQDNQLRAAMQNQISNTDMRLGTVVAKVDGRTYLAVLHSPGKPEDVYQKVHKSVAQANVVLREQNSAIIPELIDPTKL